MLAGIRAPGHFDPGRYRRGCRRAPRGGGSDGGGTTAGTVEAGKLADLVLLDANPLADIASTQRIHAVVATVGFICLQANMVRRGDLRWHKILGTAGIVVATGVYASTEYLHFRDFTTWADAFIATKVNILFMNTYALCVIAAYLNRKKPKAHKHLMFVATLYLLLPILDRVAGNTGMNVYVTMPGIWNAMFISLFVYDWVTSRRLHPVTYLGYAWFWIVWVFAILTSLDQG